MSKGKSRVLSSSAVIEVADRSSTMSLMVGEIDSFTAKSNTAMAKSRPIGASMESAYLKYGGYDLSFKGGKVDWNLANKIHAQDVLLRTLGLCPLFTVKQEIKYYNGEIETYVYNDVVLFGYSLDAKSGDEIGEEFSGYAPQRNILSLTSFGETVVQLTLKVIGDIIEETAKQAAEELLGL
jgi:hypothetical protein